MKPKHDYELTHCPILTPELVELKCTRPFDGELSAHFKWTMEDWKSFVAQVNRFDDKLKAKYDQP